MAVNETYGWDVVFATRASVVNRGLASGAGHHLSETVQQASATVQVDGDLGSWQISTGGSGALVNFVVPCAELSMSNGELTQTFTNGHFVVQGTLAFSPPPTVSPQRHDLLVVAGPKACTVLTASFPQPQFPSFSVYATTAVQAWLDAQTSLPYVLATVDVSDAERPGLGQVLAPAGLSYAYTDTSDGGGVLGILTTVRGGTTAGAELLQEVSPTALSGADTAVLVSAAVVESILEGAVSCVTLPGSTTSACSVTDVATVPVVVAGPAS